MEDIFGTMFFAKFSWSFFIILVKPVFFFRKKKMVFMSYSCHLGLKKKYTLFLRRFDVFRSKVNFLEFLDPRFKFPVSGYSKYVRNHLISCRSRQPWWRLNPSSPSSEASRDTRSSGWSTNKRSHFGDPNSGPNFMVGTWWNTIEMFEIMFNYVSLFCSFW